MKRASSVRTSCPRKPSRCETLNSELSTLAAFPGVQQTVIADDSGRLLACSGSLEPPATELLVLAHATLSAAAELGLRSGSGECHEIVQKHDSGIICLHRLPQQHLLLVRCQNESVLPVVRVFCQKWITPAPVARITSVSLDLASALHAEPSW